MSTDIDWQHELDSSFGTGNDVEPGHYVAAGRTAVRRRRATAVVLAAAVVIGGGTAWASGQGSAVRGDAPVATTRADGGQREVTRQDDAPERLDKRMEQLDRMRAQPWGAGEPPARVTPDGLEIREGAVVHERRDDVYPGKATESAALDISHDGERYWLVLEWDAGGSGLSSTRPEDGLFDTFDAFIRAETAHGGMTSPTVDDPQYMYADLVNWSGGEPELRPGATVVRTVRDPVEAKDSIGLAVRFEGEVTWMLLVRNRNGWGARHEKAEASGWPTFDLWISEQVALQTGERGLRLVEMDVDGTVSPALPDVAVLDQRAGPDLAAYGTDAATASAVALVDWRDERWFVLALLHPDQDTVITFAAAKTDGAETIDEFIAFAESRADDGGLR